MQCTEGGEDSCRPPANHLAPPGALQACAQARHARAHTAADAPSAAAAAACCPAKAVSLAVSDLYWLEGEV